MTSPRPKRIRVDQQLAAMKPILPRCQPFPVPDDAGTQLVHMSPHITDDILPQPRRRGRKPGPLSRSAREAQRKLNHSIIEKARRTKINEALATLRQLVPLPESSPSKKEKNNSSIAGGHSGLVSDTHSGDETEEDDNTSGDGDYGAPPRKRKVPPSNKKDGAGKKEEKEFKLEILERTVAYLRDLSIRYDKLRQQHEELLTQYRRNPESSPSSATDRTDNYKYSTVSTPRVIDHTAAHRGPSRRYDPLPPISSWLPISPSFLPPEGLTPIYIPQSPHSPPPLPTPPTSAHLPGSAAIPGSAAGFAKGAHIPSLSLGPTALPLPVAPQTTSPQIPHGQSIYYQKRERTTEHGLESLERSPTDISSSLRQSRTPEDEKAASLLLTMRLSHSPTSPRRYHCEASPSVHLGVGRTRTISLDSPLSQRIALPPVYGSLKTGAQSSESFAAGSGTEATTRTMAGNQVVAETPGSILGLMREHQNEHK